MRTANWHQALDIQMDTHKWYQTQMGGITYQAYVDNMYHMDRDGATKQFNFLQELEVDQLCRQEVTELRSTLHRADTCFITSDMLNLAMQAAHDMPNNEIAIDYRNLMSPVGFLLLQEGIFGEDVEGKVVGFHAIAWNCLNLKPNHATEEMEPACEIYFFSDNYDESAGNELFISQLEEYNIPIPRLAILHTFRAFDGHVIKHYGEGVRGYAIVEELLKVWYAIQLLSHQTIGTPMQLNPDRATRRRFQRDFPDTPVPLITLITLRRKTVKKDEEENGSIEWQSRWVVRGHWRKQWYPKLQRHDWKYIHEYIKGPEDKPLRLTERRVFDFRR